MTVRNLDALFSPKSVAVLGAPRTPGQRQILSNLGATVAPDIRVLIGARADGWNHHPSLADLGNAELAVAFDGRMVRPKAMEHLTRAGCRALIWATDVPVDAEFLRRARPSSLRVLGARSAGTAHPREGLNASAFVLPPRDGRVALIAQSRTVAAAALDWAEGRGLGFSWLAVTGEEADVDVADLLDYAAFDPHTHAVVLQLGRIAGARKFMSAARATARAKPVAVLQTRAAGADHGPGPDPVRSAAFARAGLVECDTLGGLFDAIAALNQLALPGEARVAVIGNGAGVCALGVDALLRQGLALAQIPDEARKKIRRQWPQARFVPGALDVGAVAAAETVAIVELLLGAGGTDVALLTHSPAPGQPHEAVAQALADSGLGANVLTVWAGLATAAAARVRCAQAGVPTFTSAHEAARALSYLRSHRRSQELLAQTPPLLEVPATDRARVAQVLDGAADARLGGIEAFEVLAAYGVGRPGRSGKGLRLHAALRRHSELGQFLAARIKAPGLRAWEAYALPPLDPLLARRWLDALGLEPEAQKGLAEALIRLANLAVEQPRVAEAEVTLAASPRRKQCTLVEASLRLDPQPPPERARLALAPYPSELEHDVRLRGGRCFRVRAIRPEDEPALIRMLEQTDPEIIRLRFFRYIRHFSHALAARFTQIDYDRELALVASPCGGKDAGAKNIGVIAMAHLIADPDGRRAEYAILVHQDYARLGLGRQLMRELLQYAARRGIERIQGEVLAENTAMLNLCRALGFSMQRNRDEPRCMLVEVEPAAVNIPDL